MSKNLKFFLALYAAKASVVGMKLFNKNVPHYPGYLALKICPDFTSRMDRHGKMIAVTGTNGKSSTCAIATSALRSMGYKVINNSGFNLLPGALSAFIAETNLLGKTKYDYAVIELDELRLFKSLPALDPDYLICVNLTRDSIKRNGHAEFMLDQLQKAIGDNIKLVLNANDGISSRLHSKVPSLYYGIYLPERMSKEQPFFVNDLVYCPKCGTKLHYSGYYFNHIGHFDCPGCGFTNPVADALVTGAKGLSSDEAVHEVSIALNGREDSYPLVNYQFVNVFNTAAVLLTLTDMGFTAERVKEALGAAKIPVNRYASRKIGRFEYTHMLQKGLNPVSSSGVMKNIKEYPGQKCVLLDLDDPTAEINGSEFEYWPFATDFGLLCDPSIKQIIIMGKRRYDLKLRLLMAGLDEGLLTLCEKRTDGVNYINFDNINTVILCFDFWATDFEIPVEAGIISRLEEISADHACGASEVNP